MKTKNTLLSMLMIIFLCIFFVLFLSSCSIKTILDSDRDKLEKEVVHEIYNNSILCENIEMLSVYNDIGNIIVKEIESNKINIKVNLIQDKRIKDLDYKLSSINIEPSINNNILFLEPLDANEGNNYWENKKNNANGIRIDYIIEIPQSIESVNLFTDIGNIDLKDINAKLSVFTSMGKIEGTKISPMDDSRFFTSSLLDGGEAINIDIKSLDNANNIEIGSDIGEVYISIPKEEYIHTIKETDIDKANDDFVKNIKNNKLEYIKPKVDKTNLITTDPENMLGELIIEEY
ncbi:hypothetical protein [Miniphocaeibacter halophilus]|uniref:Uncharacterized protein n=1 Tax=Miniphocaeibacter halophilus TaxID=2931922 RepID=A0AC61N3T3_9FIRM|nr:hypothetical protein [Miniphocaeibacter halophilus]QQK07898.1 hypothetical protein JFY71_11595 [Miniphocaeibacter halophilus]